MSAPIPSTLTMISELIALPSISCVNPQQDQSNQAVIERLANWCHDLGFKTDILPLPDYPDKFNLLATLGSGPNGLILAGHTDTVPYDVNRWQYDPFHLTVVNNHLYGLGTADMKSFFALALTAAAQFNAKTLSQPLIILATANEETNMAGVRALVKTERLQARCAVIGEPTALRPVRMHKGIFMEAIRLRGQSAHSSRPDQGNSALEGMYRLIGELLQWRQELQAAHVNPLFEVPVPTMNLGHIHGGDNPNRICGECELHLDLRPLPGMGLDELRHLLRQRVQQVLKNSQLEIQFTPLFEGIEAMETPAQAAIVQVAERLTQHSATSVAFGTEAPYLNQVGIETLILGPGDIAQAHQPNEFIVQEHLQPMIELLTQLITHFCVSSA